jgi:hypothetical protein
MIRTKRLAGQAVAATAEGRRSPFESKPPGRHRRAKARSGHVRCGPFFSPRAPKVFAARRARDSERAHSSVAVFWPRLTIGQQRCANGSLLRKPAAPRHRSFDVGLRWRFQKRMERVASATRSTEFAILPAPRLCASCHDAMSTPKHSIRSPRIAEQIARSAGSSCKSDCHDRDYSDRE